jgi:hypothetical protein
MTPKLKTILVTIVCTTAGWVLLIIGVFWCFSREADTSFIAFDDRLPGQELCGALFTTNKESQPIVLSIEERPINTSNSATGLVVLAQREIPPSGQMWIQFRRTKTGSKR